MPGMTTFEEEVHLRALTGRLVGKALADLGVNKLAIVAPKNTICSSIAAATEAGFIDHTGGVSRIFLTEPGSDEASAVERLAEYGAPVVLLQFGGETPIDVVKKSFVETLKHMAEKGLGETLVIHVRIFAAGGLDEALKDAKIKDYLASRNIVIYTVDFDRGLVLINKGRIEGDKVVLEKIREYPVTLEHADLLNRSIRQRKVSFTQ